MKYDKNGRFIRQVGSHLRGTEPYQFNTPHGIATDAQGNVYVADRGNARIQVFDNNLVLRAIYDNVGNPWEVCISPGPHQYLFSLELESRRQPGGVVGDQRRDLQDGARRQDHRQVRQGGKAVGQFQTVHGIDCRNPDELIVVGNQRLARAEDPPAPDHHDLEPVREEFHETPSSPSRSVAARRSARPARCPRS